MAWMQERRRADGGTSVRVEWRLGGGRTGSRQEETFSAGSDAQNRARAEGFKQMVEAAGSYWPDGWVKDGWFLTGDLARRDEDGWYYIVDRAKDMILRGGYNVYPREIEEVLTTHPDVSMAAVVGVPDEELGEEVKAFVIPVEGSTLTEDGLRAWSKERLAAYKYPRHIAIVSGMPVTASGKVLKRELG